MRELGELKQLSSQRNKNNFVRRYDFVVRSISDSFFIFAISQVAASEREVAQTRTVFRNDLLILSADRIFKQEKGVWTTHSL
jgi:hypothetical protein